MQNSLEKITNSLMTFNLSQMVAGTVVDKSRLSLARDEVAAMLETINPPAAIHFEDSDKLAIFVSLVNGSGPLPVVMLAFCVADDAMLCFSVEVEVPVPAGQWGTSIPGGSSFGGPTRQAFNTPPQAGIANHAPDPWRSPKAQPHATFNQQSQGQLVDMNSPEAIATWAIRVINALASPTGRGPKGGWGFGR